MSGKAVVSKRKVDLRAVRRGEMLDDALGEWMVEKPFDLASPVIQ
jgi:hypothetical protein